jgi:hypothetical protein
LKELKERNIELNLKVQKEIRVYTEGIEGIEGTECIEGIEGIEGNKKVLKRY